MAKYNIYHGDFQCQVCKVEVKTVRLYYQEKEMTWMCPEKHLSQVDLSSKKTREDYEREE
jgi:hypothetical protein